jgi:small GTP-binding protein
MESLKLVVVGGGYVGKTSIISKFTNKSDFDSNYSPTTEINEDSYKKQIQIDKINYNLQIIDTAGQKEYKYLRSRYLLPRESDGFVLVYSVTDELTFKEIKEVYISIMRSKEQDFFPMVLIGNKTDLESERVVSTEEGKKFAKIMGANFFEISAKDGNNLDDYFIQLVREVKKNKVEITSETDEKNNEKNNEINCLIF